MKIQVFWVVTLLSKWCDSPLSSKVVAAWPSRNIGIQPHRYMSTQKTATPLSCVHVMCESHCWPRD